MTHLRNSKFIVICKQAINFNQLQQMKTGMEFSRILSETTIPAPVSISPS
jgi:hypothetical protein